MILGIIGSRTFNNYDLLTDEINKLKSIYDIKAIVSGGAKGADLLGKKYAIENNLEYIEYLPDWKRFGKSAGVIRNKDIINTANIVIAFWDGVSKGTKNSIDIANKQNKKILVVKNEI